MQLGLRPAGARLPLCHRQPVLGADVPKVTKKPEPRLAFSLAAASVSPPASFSPEVLAIFRSSSSRDSECTGYNKKGRPTELSQKSARGVLEALFRLV